MNRIESLDRLIELLVEANHIANQLGLEFQNQLSDIQDLVAYELRAPDCEEAAE
jgi:hypothetical protein